MENDILERQRAAKQKAFSIDFKLSITLIIFICTALITNQTKLDSEHVYLFGSLLYIFSIALGFFTLHMLRNIAKTEYGIASYEELLVYVNEQIKRQHNNELTDSDLPEKVKKELENGRTLIIKISNRYYLTIILGFVICITGLSLPALFNIINIICNTT